MKSEQIKTARTQLGMSQQAFAAALGVSFASVNRWENGKAKPQKDRIDRIRILLRGEVADVRDAIERLNRIAEAHEARLLALEAA